MHKFINLSVCRDINNSIAISYGSINQDYSSGFVLRRNNSIDPIIYRSSVFELKSAACPEYNKKHNILYLPGSLVDKDSFKFLITDIRKFLEFNSKIALVNAEFQDLIDMGENVSNYFDICDDLEDEFGGARF